MTSKRFAPRPNVGGKSSHGGYCGPAVKPIALHLVSSVAKTVKIPISGIGGIGYWNDAAEHIALGASVVQVCTAAMHYGFRIVEDMIDGLSAYMDDHGFRTIEDFRGRAVPNVQDWGDLDLNYKIIADIHHDLCIGCQLCYVACEDGAHQCIEPYHGCGQRQEKSERDGRARSAHHRGRMRWLQSLRAGLPGGRLHHDEADRHRQSRSRAGRCARSSVSRTGVQPVRFHFARFA